MLKPRVLIVILCYNNSRLTLECLESLRAINDDHADVLVIDNASSDGTADMIRGQRPDIPLIQAGANLGFAAGNNIGLRYALDHGYDYALLLNNDTEVAADCVSLLVATADSDPAIGIVGPLICYYERPDVVWSAGGTIDWRRGRSAMRGLNKIDDGQYHALTDVDFVTGCALLCKRAVIERVGLLDERFFMYYEETEWCVRAARAGFRIVHAPQARVLHKIPLDARDDQPYVSYYMTRNRLLFLRATGARLRTWIDVALLQDMRTCVSWSLRRKWRAKWSQRNAMLQAWGDFWHGRFGPAPRLK
jgi:GT2 family glycosyltransferase